MLLGYKIGAGILGVDIKSWDSFQLDNKPAFKFSDETDPLYGEITGIVNLYNLGNSAGVDYKYLRNEIKNAVYTKAGADLSSWNTLSDSEKKVAAKLFLVPKEQRDDVYTLDEQIQLGIIFHRSSVNCRNNRYMRGVSEIYNRLESSAISEIIDEVEKPRENSGSLRNTYVYTGREGTIEGDVEGFFDWILGRLTTSFEGIGLKDKNFPVAGLITCEALSTKIIDIIKHGII